MTAGRTEGQDSHPTYRAFLVRLWRDSEHSPWRASITHVVTGEVHKFADPQLVWTHIQLQLEANDRGAEATDAE
jgi:hypothetical protein